MRRSWMVLAVLAIFAVDRWSKWLIETRLTPFDTKTIVPGFFSIIRSENAGVAFGIFSESTSLYRGTVLILFSLAALGVLGWMLWRSDRFDQATAAGMACLFGGALGNVFDRVRSGKVTDFLDFSLGNLHWYTFNIADSAICVGTALLLIAMWKKPKHAS